MIVDNSESTRTFVDMTLGGSKPRAISITIVDSFSLIRFHPRSELQEIHGNRKRYMFSEHFASAKTKCAIIYLSPLQGLSWAGYWSLFSCPILSSLSPISFFPLELFRPWTSTADDPNYEIGTKCRIPVHDYDLE